MTLFDVLRILAIDWAATCGVAWVVGAVLYLACWPWLDPEQRLSPAAVPPLFFALASLMLILGPPLLLGMAVKGAIDAARRCDRAVARVLSGRG